MRKALPFQYSDGGRADAGYKAASVGDCACRSIAIVSRLPYKEVYDKINEIAKNERIGKRKKSKSHARNGVYRPTVHKFLVDQLGWAWTPLMKIGSGCTMHLAQEEFPSKGKFVVSCSKHFTAVIDGVVHDTHDPCRDGTRCVYGYWEAP